MNHNNSHHHQHHREYTRISTTSNDHSNNHSNSNSNSLNSSNGSDHIAKNEQQPTSSASLSLSQQPATTTTSTSSSNHDGSTMSSSTSLPSRTITERITDKLMALIWVVVASIVFHYTNSAHVYLLIDNNNKTDSDHKPTANVILMQLVMIGLGINTVLFIYLLLYLPYVKGLHDSTAWDVYCPRVIPCMTLIGVCIFILLIRATYPIWGFLAPFIIGIEAMGLLFSFHFIPVGFL